MFKSEILAFLNSLAHEGLVAQKERLYSFDTFESDFLVFSDKGLRVLLLKRVAAFTLFNFIVEAIIVILLQPLKIVVKDHFQCDNFLAEPDHATSTDCGQGSMFESLNFKQESDILRNLNSLSIGQCE